MQSFWSRTKSRGARESLLFLLRGEVKTDPASPFERGKIPQRTNQFVIHRFGVAKTDSRNSGDPRETPNIRCVKKLLLMQ
jgi:hypothetical protein